jgi:hypothetical protein
MNAKPHLKQEGHTSIIVLVLLLITTSMATLHPLPVPLNEWANHQIIFSASSHKPAGLPSTNATRSFWTSLDANPLAREGSQGALTTDADVCIIGSGITGVGVAYHLSGVASSEITPGSALKVVILEARDFCELFNHLLIRYDLLKADAFQVLERPVRLNHPDLLID